jgi:LuxR family maltose regulon positive regulatory protein
LQQTHPEQIPGLYRHAAEWFAQNSLWRDAIRYALQTKDMDFGAATFEQAVLKGGLDFLYSGLRPLIEPFPAAIVQKRPLLSLAKALALFESSQIEGIEPLLRFAEKGMLASPPFPGQDEVLGWIYVVQSNVATLLGDHTWMVEASRQVPLWIPNDRLANTEALKQIGNAYYYEGNLIQTDACWQQALDLSLAGSNTAYILGMINGLLRLSFLKGDLSRAETLFQRGMHLLAEHPGQYPIWLGAMQRDYSEVLKERNRLDEARAMMTTALPLCEKWHTVSAHGCALIYMGRILLASGDIVGAKEMLDKADELRRTHTIYPDLEALAQVTRARLCLEEGETEQAWQILETCLQSACCRHEFHREWVLMGQARILRHTGRPAEALALLASRLDSAKANGRGRNWLTMRLITALALSASGDRQAALYCLGDGLVFAQAQDFRRLLVEEGEPMRELLETFRVQFPRSPLANYVAEIISIFPVPPAGAPRNSVKVEGLYESLSGREFEILRLVCQGLSNQEIARQLVLSVGTVKFHIHHIFGKLGVRDRPQAIAKAGLLGMGNS